MKESLFTIVFIGLISTSIGQALSPFFGISHGMIPMLNGPPSEERAEEQEPDFRIAVLRILETKCNQCHRRQNPFMIFKERNLEKRAKKIYRQVFELKRMPKGDEYTLTEKEYRTLRQWLKTQKL